MPQFVVTVKRLNKRRVVPMNFPDPDNIIGELAEGQTFEATEADITEVPNRALGKWYKDRDGHFYWGGGVTISLDAPLGGSLVFPQWMTDLKISQLWRFATGKKVGIGVIDTGINIQNPDLVFDKNKFYHFDQDISIEDSNGHGTHCTGLIGARNRNENAIGVAFNSSIYICKISETDTLSEDKTTRYAEAINWCADQTDIHIISISWASFINSKDILAQIQKAINNAFKKNKVILCAMGDASQFNDPGPIYPASLENIIGIGAMPVDNLLYPYINKNLVTVINGENIPSYGLSNEIIQLSGTSQANAIIAGIVALIIEKKKFQYDPAEIKKILLSLSTIQVYQEVSIPVLNSDLLLKYFQN